MRLNRRRFLTISAAAASVATATHAQHNRVWRGQALGADISITLTGSSGRVEPALARALAQIRAVEAQFSLYDPTSALSRLNAEGVLRRPDPMFVSLMQYSDQMYHATDGLFDPTVQAIWTSAGIENPAGLAHVGWNRVVFDGDLVRLDPGQALTFNGIAQGFATDLVTEVFQQAGLSDILVNIGEHRALGGPWHLGLSDPTHGMLGQRTLIDGAIATSSPLGTGFGQTGHILHPVARPMWSSVTVEAPFAVIADAASTALTLAPRSDLKRIAQALALSRISIVEFSGDLFTL